MWRLGLLALVACERAPRHVALGDVCDFAGQRVVVEGLFEWDVNMVCEHRVCVFTLRDGDQQVPVQVPIPEGVDGITAKYFPGAGGKGIRLGQRSVITGRVVADPPTCRITLIKIEQP